MLHVCECASWSLLQPGLDGPPTSIMGTTWTRSNFKKHTTNNASKQHQHQGIAV
ncbi:hypothetical protein JOQ06_012549, partial [Pogonophryne albipinna]